MWNNIGLEHCLAFINCQLSPRGGEQRDNRIKPVITISRMAGAGGRTVAGQLATYLQTHVPDHAPWTVFDRKLVEQVLEDHKLSKRIAEFMPEDHKSMLADLLEELFDVHPSSWTLVQQTAETILHLAQLGNVILVGRGANVVTRKMENSFHVRLVGSLENRIGRVQEVFEFDRPTAVDFINREDKGRRRYLKEHFQEDIDNPLLYHLVINTDHVPYEAAAQLIGETVIRRFHLDRHVLAVEI